MKAGPNHPLYPLRLKFTLYNFLVDLAGPTLDWFLILQQVKSTEEKIK